MALITFGSAPTKGATSTATLNKTELLAIPEVVADSFWSDGSNIKSVEIMFESVGGGQAKPLVFNFSQTTPTASLVLSEKARSSFQVKAITLRDFDDGIFTITRAVLLASSPSVAASVLAISFVPAPVGGGDTTPPTPGTGIQITNTFAGGISLSWGAATDNVTASGSLQYAVVGSLSSNIGTVSQAEANSILSIIYGSSRSTTYTGLTPGALYYLSVIVKDSAGNKAVYPVVSAVASDVVAPTVTLSLAYDPISSPMVTASVESLIDNAAGIIVCDFFGPFMTPPGSVSEIQNGGLMLNPTEVVNYTTPEFPVGPVGAAQHDTSYFANEDTLYYAVIAGDESGNYGYAVQSIIVNN